MGTNETGRMSEKVVVTGVTGFVGGALAKRLLTEGYEVHGLSRQEPRKGLLPELIHHKIDISSPDSSLSSILDRASCVFHCAAKVDMWGIYKDFFKTNVLGTRNLLKESKKAGIPYFIFTSSPSVIANRQDLCKVNESIPYPTNYLAYYPQTKAIAEKEVLAENNPQTFRTVSLRPHLIFGPGDRNLAPSILKAAKNNRLFKIGTGNNLVDVTYIDDCIEAHILAYKALRNQKPIDGKAYFISQGEPVNLWDWIDEILDKNNLPKLTKRISSPVASILATFSEIFFRFLPFLGAPTITRFLVSEMSTSHYFDISAAQRDLEFNPRLSVSEALEKTWATHKL